MAPTLEWLKEQFAYGYDSGDILAPEPDERRRGEEDLIGGSYGSVFDELVRPHLAPGARVLELGPGRGSWTRAILATLAGGEVHTVDFQDVRPWLQPERYPGRLICHRVRDNSFAGLPRDYFDFFWSFGVLCHCNQALIAEILRNALPCLHPGGRAAHQYADWDKLAAWGWGGKSGVPAEFQDLPDDAIWWPRNDQATMARLAQEAGWRVDTADAGLLARDGIILLARP
ncbi:MAG: class I SAM-dependent methyltransferase [Deltaproteobacteria bacterium]|nr:class I SAM-dependent methyltransferase [Deltaproteobacteria bacterium]